MSNKKSLMPDLVHPAAANGSTQELHEELKSGTIHPACVALWKVTTTPLVDCPSERMKCQDKLTYTEMMMVKKNQILKTTMKDSDSRFVDATFLPNITSLGGGSAYLWARPGQNW